ncbi:MAG: 3-methyl-2-oxobutanoate hydroxymethyltransferase [Zoogloeaceae bacterium]|jgi:3-methyl-2-oxobutanoate hydroxymethyltransferase|nr:3-methyl-2-oxobutanoate hydroxymethyltransferase [Zoogloeaceae bacterium]
MSAHSDSRRLTHFDLQALRQKGEKIAILTCYDASFAQMLDEAGVDVLLVGDSLGNVVQGQESTLPVMLKHMIYHTEAVVRGSRRALVVADFSFGSSQISPEDTFRNAVRLMAAGAQMVKLEGGAEMAATVAFLTLRGIPVCAHIGLTPQSVHQLGGFRVQGRSDAAAQKLLADARALEAAGASLIVLEAIPATLAAEVTRALVIPTIGIGAGAETSGQVLVVYDMLNIGARARKKPRFVRDFMAGAASLQEAVAAYVSAVKDGSFPAAEHTY